MTLDGVSSKSLSESGSASSLAEGTSSDEPANGLGRRVVSPGSEPG